MCNFFFDKQNFFGQASVGAKKLFGEKEIVVAKVF